MNLFRLLKSIYLRHSATNKFIQIKFRYISSSCNRGKPKNNKPQSNESFRHTVTFIFCTFTYKAG